EAAASDAALARLGVSAVVLLDEDQPQLNALPDATAFTHRPPVGPLIIFERGTATTIPIHVAGDRWSIPVEGQPGEWVSLHVAYYPLWRARRNDASLASRHGPAWDLEVRLDDGRGPVELRYRATAVEMGATMRSEEHTSEL